MLSYLVHLIHAFIAVALLTGVLLALWNPLRGAKRVRPMLVSLGFGLMAGGALYPVALRLETLTAARATLYGIAIVAALAHTALLFLPGARDGGLSRIKWGASLLFLAALSATGSFSFAVHVAEQALTSVTVLNTELILNLGGVLLGLALIVLLVPVTAHLAAKSAGVLRAILLISSMLLVLQWSSELMLGLMRLDQIALTSLRLSFVAKVTKYLYLLPYLQALQITWLALAFFRHRPVVAGKELAQMEKAQRRKARSLVLLELRWFKGALSCVGVVLAVCLYFDLYASRPVKITPPTMMTPDAAGLIKINIDQVKTDGKLYRYAIVTDDGHVVRFCLINRSLGQGGKVGVVYDACMLCGDMGYIQEKNEVICIACNVRIFRPSIGKAGGCNPIPLEHTIEGNQVVLRIAELDKGAKYFTEVVSRKVKDPVTGKELDSSKAPFRHEYKGRTYFFESEESGDKFQKSPESYVGEQQSRYYRAQGFQGTVASK